jgi:hypothetical protein
LAESLADGVEGVVPNHRSDYREATDCNERQQEALTQAERRRSFQQIRPPHSLSLSKKLAIIGPHAAAAAVWFCDLP